MGREENEAKKQYLRGYERACRQQKRLEEELEEVKEERILPGITTDGMPHGSRKQNDLSEYMVRLEKAETKLIEAIIEKREIREEINRRIEQMDNENQKDVLRKRYIDLMAWDDICEDMHYSKKQIHRIHNAALWNIDTKRH